MTMPTSGALSMSRIASELGIGASGLNLGRATIRSLAGNGGGAISFSSLYGKSNIPQLSVRAVGDNVTAYSNIRGGSISSVLTALPAGGDGSSYFYSWVLLSGNAQLFYNTNQACTISASYAKMQNYVRNITVQCTVTCAGQTAVSSCTITLIVDSLQ